MLRAHHPRGLAVRAGTGVAAAALLVTICVKCTYHVGPLVACDGAHANCDRVPDNGCEIDLTSSTENCGACGHSCAPGTCAGSQCQCQGKLVRCKGPAPEGCVNVDTDVDHCGTCNHGCLGGACLSGRCQPVVLADDEPLAYGIALDDANVYWVASALGSKRGTIRTIAKTGDPATLRTIAESTRPRFLAVDDGNVYWTDEVDGTVYATKKAATTATAPRALVPTSATALPWEIALDAEYVYYGLRGSSTIQRVQKSGGPATLVASADNPASIAVDDAYVYWTNKSDGGPNGTVARQRKDTSGGAGDLLSIQEVVPDGLAIDGTMVYWTTFQGTAVKRVSKEMPWIPTPLAAGQGEPNGIAVDDAGVYWTTFVGDNRLSRVDLDGGAQVTLIDGGISKGPLRVAVDDKAIYLTLSGGDHSPTFAPGAVIRLAK